MAYYLTNQTAKSISDFERSIKLNPMEFKATNNLAWILATCPNDEFRDGDRALQLANTAGGRTGFSVWYCLKTLAAAHAETGDFELACNFAEESRDLAPETDVSEFTAQLKSYKAKVPWREAKPSVAMRN